MRLLDTIWDMQMARKSMIRPLGLVPTMGTLHEGHLSLARKALEENSSVVVSIFINPAQFGPLEDFQTYPRHLEQDLALLQDIGIDNVFIPKSEEMYPAGFDTSVNVGGIADRLEGEFRPGHFLGVATIVTKLFTTIRPDKAYFGQKDAQQILVIRRLNADLNLGAKLVTIPTVREQDGLAMSSRNSRMSTHERQSAVILYHSLCLAEDMYSNGERQAEYIKASMSRLIESEPLAHPDYISIADYETLEELDFIQEPALVSLAVHIGQTRLIDNIVLGTKVQ